MRSTPLEQLRPETLSIGVGELVLAVRQLLRQPSNRRQQPSEQLLFHTAFGQHVHRAVVESCLRRGIVAQPKFLPPIVAKYQLLAENVLVAILGSRLPACETQGGSER
jgi:hypothetical protein